MPAFTILSDEGLPIRGNLDAPEKPLALVVIVHGFKGFKDWGFFPWVGERLLQHRLAVCRFNMSRSGIGDDPETFGRLDLFEHDTYSIELADLRAVVRHAQAAYPTLPTFLVGHSRGGAVALLGASDVPNLHGVVAWSPISHCDRWDEATIRDWRGRGFLEIVNARTKQVMRQSIAVLDDVEKNGERLDVLAAAGRLRAPLFVIHGAKDDSVPVEEGKNIAGSCEDGSLLILHGASHTYNAIHPLVNVPFELVIAAEATAHFVRAQV
ncbi:MAG TPA: alpha/beta fold hydrolase [Thermoanaerobaculia bacterium]|nr:alpha/beta fold hydrolase [Thermoanaerobaculia bacterium]